MRIAVSIALFGVLLAGCPSKLNPPPAPTDKDISGGPGGENPDEKKKGGTPAGTVWLLRDNGKRCFAAPCPSWTATDVSTRAEREVTGVDVTALKIEGEEAQTQREKVLSGQVWARGEIKTIEKAGPAGDGHVLFVTELLDANDPVDAAKPKSNPSP